MRWKYISGENAHWIRPDGWIVRRLPDRKVYSFAPDGMRAPGYHRNATAAMADVDAKFPVTANA